MIDVIEINIEEFKNDIYNEYIKLFPKKDFKLNNEKRDGRECYIIRDGNTEKFIDIDTGLAIKMIDNENNRTTDYKYEFNVVKDKDASKPDTTGYEIRK